ncbi:MAG: acyl-CoA dehydratase activase, partial [Deltaproteobacteria bacterium]|nr:acyl-CoA dehydratase activase [Deltaproteobacteria bacterium]
SAIAYGLCRALARTFAATVLEGRSLTPPVVLAGGGAMSAGLRRALAEVCDLSDSDFRVPDDPLVLGAAGAASLAEKKSLIALDRLATAAAAAGLRISDVRGDVLDPLPPLPEHEDPPEVPPPPGGPVRAYLGVDVGSVSTNLALLTPSFELLMGVYLRTRGNPMEAISEGLALVRERFGERLEVLGVGTTGSGRHLAARLLGADVVKNEITAQMISAAHYVPEVDTVFEIGGQDSKYIGTRRGHLAGFAMNKICAAGTGSFLEEQAGCLGVSIVDEFAQLARQATAPRDLGSRCTVFMDAELRRALKEGTSLPDIAAGLAYSVARNYLGKVVAGREVGRNVVFQGGTASNAAVVAAMSRILGREVRVHPHNRISGAIGMALLALREMRASPYVTRFLGMQACEGARASTFECRACENRCEVSRIRVGGRVAHFGDACEKHAGADGEGSRAPRPFPELFAERDRLLEEHMRLAVAGRPKGSDRGQLGIPRASVGLELAPFFATAVARLGFTPILSSPTTVKVAELGARGLPAEVCLPIKVAAGHARALLAEDPDRPVLAPSVREMGLGGEESASHTCMLTQEWPHMMPGDGRGRVIEAQLAIGAEPAAVTSAATVLAPALGVSFASAVRALYAASSAHDGFCEARQRLGREALASKFDRAVVVLGRPYNLHDPHCNLRLARHLARVGLPAIPMDLLPVDDVELGARWRSVPWHFGRQILKAVTLMRRDDRLFPVAVSSYGCGVDGFVFKHLEEMLGDRPNLLLEFDEHRAEAGLVTRLEAFADEIEEHLRRGKPSAPLIETPGTPDRPSGRRFFIPNLAEFSHVFAGAVRSAGYEARVLPEPTGRTLALGEAVSSGRECHPSSIVAGQIAELLFSGEVGKGDTLLNFQCASPCLLRQYGDFFRIVERRTTDGRLAIWDTTGGGLDRITGTSDVLRFYDGLVALDFLTALAHRVRPYAGDPVRPLVTLGEAAVDMGDAIAGGLSVKPILTEAALELDSLAVRGRPGDLPVVGITGDLYTRMHPTGNAGLFDRLFEMGVEVWPSTFFGLSEPFSNYWDLKLSLGRLRVRRAASLSFAFAVTAGLQRFLLRGIPEDVAALGVEPRPRDLAALGAPYVGPHTSWLVLSSVSKLVDFFDRGCSGAVNAFGVNCMVGTAISGAIPAVRRNHGGAPIISLAYGGPEGPGQRIRLETFVHQVRSRFERGRR